MSHVAAASGGTSEAAPYAIEMQAKCLAAVPSAGTHSGGEGGQLSPSHAFLVGSNAPRGTNRLYLLEYREEPHLVDCIAVWDHAEPICAMSVAAQESGGGPGAATRVLVAACHQSVAGAPMATFEVIRLSSDLVGDVEPLLQIRLDARSPCIAWQPVGLSGGATVDSIGSCVLAARNSIYRLPIAQLAGAAKTASFTMGVPNNATALPVTTLDSIPDRCAMPTAIETIHSITCDPHHKDIVAVAADTSLVIADLRAKQAQLHAAHAPHRLALRSVDYNPNRIYVVATCGDDGQIKVWDLRKAGASVSGGAGGSAGGDRMVALASHQGHDHRATCVRYNPSHDELLLSGGVDQLCRLWCLSSLSSKPLSSVSSGVDGAPPATASTRASKDGVIRSLTDVGETVTSVAWSSSDPWVYAVCGFNGRVFIDRVPDESRLEVLMGE